MVAKEAIEHQIPIATSIDTTNNRYSPDDSFIQSYPKLKNAFDFVTLPGFDVLKAKAIHKMCINITSEQEHLIPSLDKVPHYRIDENCVLVEAIDKYQGIIKMMNYLHAPLEDVVVFGDGRNDLPMFKQAPFSIAMGNAIQELKDIASYITDKASKDGIYKACEHFGWSNTRNATLDDLDVVAMIEAIGFPEAEAASRSSIEKRINAFSDCFWLLEKDQQVVGFVNGMATDLPNLSDEMYDLASMHNKDGKWQMIFSLSTLPEYRRQGLARILLNTAIEDARRHQRLGVVLTCKDQLVHYYESFGFINEGISKSTHGNAIWYDMRLTF